MSAGCAPWCPCSTESYLAHPKQRVPLRTRLVNLLSRFITAIERY